MVHLVSYELKGYRHPADYHNIGEQIKAISGTWCHLGESRWLVETDLSTQAIAERLAPLTLIGDQVFVTRIYRDWSAYGLTSEQIAWLNARNFMSWWEILTSLVSLPKPARAVTALPSLANAVRHIIR